MRYSAVLATFLLAMAVRAQESEGFSLEQVLSPSFPYGLVSAPKGAAFAWVLNEKGAHNIWFAEAPDFEARRLTDFMEDEGRSITILGITEDGARLVFQRSGRLNPLQKPDGAPGTELYHVASEGGEPKKIGSVKAAALSTATGEIAYVDGGSLWITSLDPEAEPQKAATPTGRIEDLAWSPDGSGLVFANPRVNNRHEYGFIAHYDRASGALSFLDPSVYEDGRPSWSPDGTRIAFMRCLGGNSQFTTVSYEFPQPDPVQIRVHDLATGQTNVAWSSTEGENYWFMDYAWLDDRRLVFISEATGWRQLYLVGVGGGGVEPLTRGEFVVETLHVPHGGGRAYYVANAGDIDRRHLWRTDGKGKPVQLTSGDGIEWSPVPSADGKWLAWLGSDAREPAQAFAGRLPNPAGRKLAPQAVPESFPLGRMVTPEQAVFESADGWKIHGQLFMPPDRFEGKRPAVMYFHGGPVRQMLLGWHYSNYYHNGYALNQYLASRGFVVLAVNYRLGIGYGKAFRDVPDGGLRGASEYRDVLAGARFLRGLERVDGNRIGLWGGSYGGTLTAQGLARNSDLFAAGVDFHGVHDWNTWRSWVTPYPYDENRTAWRSSVLSDLGDWSSPVLLIHGDGDANVDFAQTVWLAKELRARNVTVETLVFPDESHSFLRHHHWLRAFVAAADFLERTLKP